MRLVGATLVGALLSVSVVAVLAQRGGGTSFEGARIVIGDGRVIESGVLVTDAAGRIARVGRMGEFVRPAGATRIDVSGKTIIPALIDAHVHVGFENTQSWRAENYTRDTIVDTLDRLAYYGVGAVFSSGTDNWDTALEIERDQAAGRIGGARFVFAAGFGPPNAGPNQQLLNELARLPPHVGAITGDADARSAARAVAARGIRFVKVWVTDRNGTQPKMKPEAYRAIIDESHKLGLRVVAHATDTLEDAKDLARAGLDGSMHAGLDADPEFAALMKKNDAFLIPTQGLNLRGNIPGMAPWFEDPFFQEAVLPSTLERYRRQRAALPPAASNSPSVDERLVRVGRMLKVLQDGGVRIAVGGDSGATPDYPPGYPMHREMALYVQAGMTPAQVLTAATKSGAEALGLARELGTLEAGKRASLVVLNANPLTDIAKTKSIAAVYLDGRQIDRAALRTRLTAAH